MWKDLLAFAKSVFSLTQLVARHAVLIESLTDENRQITRALQIMANENDRLRDELRHIREHETGTRKTDAVAAKRNAAFRAATSAGIEKLSPEHLFGAFILAKSTPLFRRTFGKSHL